MLGAPAPRRKKVALDPAYPPDPRPAPSGRPGSRWRPGASRVYPASAMKTGVGQAWAVEVLSVGAATVGAVAWRLSGRLNISAIVKATFSFAPGGSMTPTL